MYKSKFLKKVSIGKILQNLTYVIFYNISVLKYAAEQHSFINYEFEVLNPNSSQKLGK